MKQINAKLKTGAQNVSILAYNNERLILNALFWSFGILAVVYVLLLGNMVRNVVERRGLETSMRTISNEVGDLELTYLAASKNIDLNFSHSLGFKETKAVYATRKSLGFGNVKLAQNEI
ncbi:MAG: hypothetical protein Q7K54_03760 [Candidatus Parcubacteria bacterium]|nr:hypothetical protein [Candidatus Parcubacteria bacterium]